MKCLCVCVCRSTISHLFFNAGSQHSIADSPPYFDYTTLKRNTHREKKRNYYNCFESYRKRERERERTLEMGKYGIDPCRWQSFHDAAHLTLISTGTTVTYCRRAQLIMLIITTFIFQRAPKMTRGL